ncbi:MAG: Uma2 family endonuclease [Bacteroidota bacterium]
MEAIVIRTESIGGLTNEQLFHFCQENSELVIERNADGEIIIMTPTGGFTGKRSGDIFTDLNMWNRIHQLGIAFDSSTGFVLPNGAMRSPDACWISQERWQALTWEEKKHFPPLCPDFVVELRSSSDNLKILQKKMQEWQENGCQLAWLIDAEEEKVYLYRPQCEVEVVIGFDAVLLGERVLPGFSFSLAILRSN